MPRQRWVLDDETESESEFSETDVSFTRPGRRTSVKRRSFSRNRRHSPNSNAFLSPAIIAPPIRRSASTGGRRRRENDPIVVVDVHNDVHAKQDSRDHRRNNIDQRDQRLAREDDIEEIDIIRSHRRPRIVADVPASRTPSPRQQQRDWELLMDQRLLAKNDLRQDMELAKQQQEIERLERQLAKSREKRREERHGSVSRHRLAEEEIWEEELAERLHKLDRLERAKRTEEEEKLSDYRAKIKRLEEIEREQRTAEEQKQAEYRAKVKRLEEAERKAAEEEEARRLAKIKRLEEMERKAAEEEQARRLAKIKRLEDMERKAAEEEEAKRIAQEKHLKEIEKQQKIKAERDRIIKEIKDEEARKALEEEERKRELAELKRKAILEFQQAEEAKKLKEIEEKKAKDKEFKERLKLEFGYSEEDIEKMLKKKHEQEEKKEQKKEGGGAIVVLEPPREKTTFIRVHRKYLLPATLDAFKLPWDWDDRDGNYIIIKQWISEDFQEELFAHTRRLRGGKLIEETSTTLTELKVNDRKRDKMYLVRKKNPGRSWIFT